MNGFNTFCAKAVIACSTLMSAHFAAAAEYTEGGIAMIARALHDRPLEQSKEVASRVFEDLSVTEAARILLAYDRIAQADPNRNESQAKRAEIVKLLQNFTPK